LLRVLAAVLTLVALAVACGGDDDDIGPIPGTSSPTPGGSQTATTSPGESPSPTGGPSETPGSTYTVQPGDTLYSIALQFGTTVEAIAAANGIEDVTQIEPGQVLIIPQDGATVAPTTPPAGGPAQVVRYGDTSRKVVAFTFDAGSDAGYTGLILDILRDNGITASFGMTGRWAEKYPDLLQRVVNEGHTLINHTYTHRSFTGYSDGAGGLSQEERWEELDSTEQIVQDLTGATTKPYFRPPYGDYDESVNADVGARGYSYNVMWAVDSRGWTGIPAAEITQRCLDLGEPGAIYVFHVGSASQDGPALQGIIDGLRADGFEITDLPGALE
jgi:peptidoglycan/xylan/chitin deacetylase (PgdA/CDA1 family)